MKKILINLLILLGLTAVGQAGNLSGFEKKCEKGDGDACATLGAVHAQGKYVKKDMKKAAELWKRGCDLGSASSCTTYAMVIQDEKERIKVLKKACDLGNENGCLSYEQTLLMKELQDGCVKKGNIQSCRKMGEEVFLAGEYDQGKLILDDICKMGDNTSCSELETINARKDFLKLGFVEDLKKKCNEGKDKFACEKVGGFLIGINGYVMSVVKTDAEKKSVLPEVMMNLTMGQFYIKEACTLGRKESCRTLKGLEASQKRKK